MKNLLVVAILFLFGIRANTQVDFGVMAGPQMTSAKYTIKDSKQKTEMKFGFLLGGMMKTQWEGRLYFSPVAFYSLKGFRVTLAQAALPPDSFAIDNDITLHTFEIAPMLQYNFSDAADHMFVKLGPSLDIQITGKEKFNRSTGSPVDRKMKFGFGDYGYVGANIILQLGYETSSGLLFAVQYGHGVGSIVNKDNGPSVLHRTIGLTLGKYFKKD